MKSAVLVSGFLLSVVALAHGPSPLLADDGRDLSFLLKRYDGPVPILHRTVKGKRHAVPRTLQVEEVPIRRALNGLVERQQCTDPGYVPCPGSLQCCPAGTVCGSGACCLAGNLPCAGKCKDRYSFLRLSLPLTHRRSAGCPDALGDCCLDNQCCPAGQVSACTLLTNLAYFSSGLPQVCVTDSNGAIGCCPRGQTCSGTVTGE